MVTKKLSRVPVDESEWMALWEGAMRKWRWQETDRWSEGQRDYGKEPQSACKPNTVFCSLGVQKERAQIYGLAQSAGGVSWGGTWGKEVLEANFRVTSRLLQNRPSETAG